MKNLFKHPLIVFVLSFTIMFLGFEYLISLNCKYPEQPYQWKIIVTLVLVIISCLIGIISGFVCFFDCFDSKKKYEPHQDECVTLKELAEEKESLSIKPHSKLYYVSCTIIQFITLGLCAIDLINLEKYSYAIVVLAVGFLLFITGLSFGACIEQQKADEKKQIEEEKEGTKNKMRNRKNFLWLCFFIRKIHKKF